MFNADGTCTYSAQTFTAGTAPVAGYEATNFARLVTTGQTLSSALSILIQRIEDVRTFANQTVTVSFWAKTATGTPKIAIELDQNFGSGGSTRVTTAVGQPTISTSWARYSATIPVPSISGKTIGATNYLSANLIVSAGSDYNSRTGSLGIQTNTFDIWGVQVEASSTASDFQTATGTIQGELAACQRYFYRLANNVANEMIGTGSVSNTNFSYPIVYHPVEMRVAPSFSKSSLADFIVTDGTSYTPTTFDADVMGTKTSSITVAVIGLVLGRAVRVYRSGSASGSFIQFSSEL
jgi:hypothetical protein